MQDHTKHRTSAVKLLIELCESLERGKGHIKYCHDMLHPCTDLHEWWEEQKKITKDLEKE